MDRKNQQNQQSEFDGRHGEFDGVLVTSEGVTVIRVDMQMP